MNINMHVLGALFIMGGGNAGMLVAGLAFRRGPFRRLQPATLIIGAIAFVAAILHFIRTYAGPGMGGTERIAVFALEAWLVMMAVFILRSKGVPEPTDHRARRR